MDAAALPARFESLGDTCGFGFLQRRHWGIENRLHWVLDVVLHDDLARLRTGHGPANMAVIRHMAPNLLRQATPTTSLEKPPQASRMEHRLPRRRHPAARLSVHSIAVDGV